MAVERSRESAIAMSLNPTRLWRRAFAPVDISSIVFFRIVFGGLVVWHVWRYFVTGTVAALWRSACWRFSSRLDSAIA